MIKVRKNKSPTLDSTTVISEEQSTDHSCVKCNKIFSKPIELTIRTEGSPETYYACPHCFSRLSVSDNLKKRPIKPLREPPLNALTKPVKDTTEDVEKDKPVDCAHFLGYLKKRPKSSPIPDECLTCASIMQCMGFVSR